MGRGEGRTADDEEGGEGEVGHGHGFRGARCVELGDEVEGQAS